MSRPVIIKPKIAQIYNDMPVKSAPSIFPKPITLSVTGYITIIEITADAIKPL